MLKKKSNHTTVYFTNPEDQESPIRQVRLVTRLNNPADPSQPIEFSIDGWMSTVEKPIIEKPKQEPELPKEETCYVKVLLDFFRNSIRSVKPCFLAPSTPNFSAMCIHMAKKLGGESAQKSLVSPTKANFERSLLLQSCIFPSNFAIVEGNASIRKDLNAFMALSSDENNIFFFCQIDCQVNRFFAI